MYIVKAEAKQAEKIVDMSIETCGSCPEMNACEKLAMITGNNADALRRLKEQSGECDDNKK